MLRKRSEENDYVDYLPCAGITLFRFYGYYLSRPAIMGGQHPEELITILKSAAKIGDYLNVCNI